MAEDTTQESTDKADSSLLWSGQLLVKAGSSVAVTCRPIKRKASVPQYSRDWTILTETSSYIADSTVNAAMAIHGIVRVMSGELRVRIRNVVNFFAVERIKNMGYYLLTKLIGRDPDV